MSKRDGHSNWKFTACKSLKRQPQRFALVTAAMLIGACTSTHKQQAPDKLLTQNRTTDAVASQPAIRSGHPNVLNEPKIDAAMSSKGIIDHLLAQRQDAFLKKGQLPEKSSTAALEPAHSENSEEPSRKFRHRHRNRHGHGKHQEVLVAEATESVVAGSETRPVESVAEAKSELKSRSRTKAPKIVAKAAEKNPVKSTDYWDAARSNLVLTGLEHETLAATLQHLSQNPKSVDSLFARAEPYLPYLLNEIKRQGLPFDLLMVPMVESAFQTSAVSPKQAAGIWQFIPETGQRFGLTVNASFDGRYDTHAATQAALKYLKHLNKLFNGDWLLALASYNAGEGAVQRAIDASLKAGLTGSFWDLRLPSETEAYVLKIVALSRIMSDPSAYGIKTRKAVGLPHLTRVEAAPEVKVEDLITSAGMNADLFYNLNPAYKPGTLPPAQTRNFLMPPNHAETLMTANMAGTKVYATRKVVVQKGETLTILAKRHGVSELKLAEWNGLKPKSHLKAGQELLVYPV